MFADCLDNHRFDNGFGEAAGQPYDRPQNRLYLRVRVTTIGSSHHNHLRWTSAVRPRQQTSLDPKPGVRIRDETALRPLARSLDMRRRPPAVGQRISVPVRPTPTFHQGILSHEAARTALRLFIDGSGAMRQIAERAFRQKQCQVLVFPRFSREVWPSSALWLGDCRPLEIASSGLVAGGAIG